MLLLVLKLNPLYAQTYVYIGKLGSTAVFKRAEKIYGDWSVAYADGRIEMHKNEHVGWSYDDNNSIPNSKEYAYCELKDKKYIQILSGMNMCEVIEVKPYPTYKEILYWHDGTAVEFKNGLVK
jgi:hypothetical protein